MKKILITGTSLAPKSFVEYLTSKGFEVIYHPQDHWTAEELHSVLQGVSGYMIGGKEEVTAEHFEQAGELEVVVWLGIDSQTSIPQWKRAYELGIAVVTTPETNINAVAEYTIGLALILVRKIGYRFETLRSKDPFVGAGSELRGKTLGIVGMGSIGVRVAQIAKLGFGMNVVYTNRTRYSPLENELGIQYANKDDLLAISDVVSLHRADLAEGESPEIASTELAIMKDGAILINTAKWDLVHLDALFRALVSGKIMAAAI